LHKFIIAAMLACAASLAHAADAGRIVFVAGAAQAGDRPAAEGAMVQEGQLLSTGGDGYVYIKTADNGLFILRPNTKARIVTYQIDRQNPSNTRVKFELISGTARSKSGDAVKHARQNFRFNTPVAAIGVRGTDFTVVTDSETSRVSVFSGGVVVSGFAGGCRPDGAGPCEGAASRELSAAQRGQLLQITRGQAAPVMLEEAAGSSASGAPARSDEPVARNGDDAENTSGRPGLDAEKTAKLPDVIAKAPPPAPDTTPTPPVNPPVVTPPVVTLPPKPEPAPAPELTLPDRAIVWGRWQVVAGLPPRILLGLSNDTNELLALNGNYALLRSPSSSDYVSPNNGSIGFRMRDSEAFVYTDYTPTYRTTTAATLSNGVLTVDFGNKSFSTSVDMASSAGNAALRADGQVGKDGRLYGNLANGRTGYMNVQGMLSSQNGGSAAYIFDSRLDERRTVNGATYWEKK
jgi:hypothetical protein